MTSATVSSFPKAASPAPTRKPSGRLRRALVGVVATSLVATGAVGLLHLPLAAPLLRAISPSSVCPIMRGSPEQIDRAHAVSGSAIRASASQPAPARPALVFTLDRTGRADIDAWAAKHRVACSSIGGNENLQRCKDVPAAAVAQPDAYGPLEEVTFELDAKDRLRTVETMRRRLTPARASEVAAGLEQSTASALGAPSSVGGTPTEAHLARALMSTYVAEHTFVDYRASITATNLAPTGVMVREQYISTTP